MNHDEDLNHVQLY